MKESPARGRELSPHRNAMASGGPSAREGSAPLAVRRLPPHAWCERRPSDDALPRERAPRASHIAGARRTRVRPAASTSDPVAVARRCATRLGAAAAAAKKLLVDACQFRASERSPARRSPSARVSGRPSRRRMTRTATIERVRPRSRGARRRASRGPRAGEGSRAIETLRRRGGGRRTSTRIWVRRRRMRRWAPTRRTLVGVPPALAQARAPSREGDGGAPVGGGGGAEARSDAEDGAESETKGISSLAWKPTLTPVCRWEREPSPG